MQMYVAKFAFSDHRTKRGMNESKSKNKMY